MHSCRAQQGNCIIQQNLTLTGESISVKQNSVAHLRILPFGNALPLLGQKNAPLVD